MQGTNDTERQSPDSLAELVRAAGRRPIPPQAHYDQVYSAARAAWRAKLRRRRNRWFALAAAAVLVLTSGFLFFRTPSELGPAATLVVAQGSIEQLLPDSTEWEAWSIDAAGASVGARLKTGNESRAALRLAGGGSLRLDENTEVLLNEENIALASGRIYFDSADRTTGSGISIATPLGEIRDIGTQFEVSLSATSLRVRVREGRVALSETALADELMGAAGEELELGANGELSRRPVAPDDPVWAWTQAVARLPAITSRSILAYLRWIARETGKPLEFESDAVELAAELASFGGDPAGFSPLELLSQISATSDFDYRLTEDGTIAIGRK